MSHKPGTTPMRMSAVRVGGKGYLRTVYWYASPTRASGMNPLQYLLTPTASKGNANHAHKTLHE
jgi:hypothetical protein